MGYRRTTAGGSTNAASLAVKDEGTTAVAAASALNFVGAGVTASDGGSGTATVTIPGAPAIPSPTTGTNPLTGFFQMVGYGVVADAVTRNDGAMPSTSTLTSAGATFTSADVGKAIVVNNAKGAGVHLYTTIATFVDATHVTLTLPATVTITGAVFTYGTDNTTNAQACINAAQAVHGVVLLPPTPFVVTSALAITDGVTIMGLGAVTLSGHFTSTDYTSCQTPLDPPFLAGAVIVQAGKDQHGITISCTGGGRAVDLRTFGVYFAGQWANTGHGVYVNPPLVSGQTYQDNGIEGFKWENLYVYGHDGTHYGAWLTNMLLGTITHFMSWGGGGMAFEAHGGVVNWGNLVVSHAYIGRIVSGAVHGFYFKPTGGTLNLITMIRPQTVDATQPGVGSHFTPWGITPGPTGGNALDTASGVGPSTVIAPDFEWGTVVGHGGGMPRTYGADFFNATVADGAPWGDVYNSVRRFNRDFSKSLDTAEGAGNSWWLLNDIPAAAKWAITTDGTAEFLRPGYTRHTGGSVTAVGGAALGTTPPPVWPSGANTAGRAIFGTGTSPAAGAVGTFTFSKALQVGPVITLTPNNAATQALGLYVSAQSTTAFTVSCANAPSASQAITVYDFSWTVEDATAAPAAPVVYDSFDKTDSNTAVGAPQIGPSPSIGTGGVWGISSNQAYQVSTSGSWGSQLVWDASKADATAQVTISTLSGVPGLVFRYVNATSFLYASPTEGKVFYYNGGWTQQGATFTSSWASGDTVKVTTSGSTVTVYKNGTLIYTQTITQNQTATLFGLQSNNNFTARFNNFSVA